MLHRGAMPARLLGRALTVMLVAAVLILYAAGANIWLIAAGVALYGVANGMVPILRGIAVADHLGVAGFQSEEPRLRTECCSSGSSLGSPDPKKKKNTQHN